MNIFTFLHDFTPNPILFNFGIFKIHWYGLVLAFAVSSGFLIFRRLFVGTMQCIVQHGKTTKFYHSHATEQDDAPRRTLRCIVPTEFAINLFFYATIFSILGGRLFHILTFLNYYLQNPLEIFAIWHGGIAFYGVFVFGLGSLFFFSGKSYQEKYRNKDTKIWRYGDRIKKNLSNFVSLYLHIFISFLKSRFLPFLFIMDATAPALALVQSIGRWGNWFNQELFGQPCNYNWCIPIDFIHRPVEYLSSTHFHPIFLYESVGMLIIFFILLLVRSCCHSDRATKIFFSQGKSFSGKWRNPFAMDRESKQESLVAGGTEKGSPASSAGQALDSIPPRLGSARDDKVGIIFTTYLLFHASIRFTLEFLRLDPQPVLLGLRLFQWFAIAEFLIGVALVFVLRKWYNKSSKTLEHSSTQTQEDSLF